MRCHPPSPFRAATGLLVALLLGGCQSISPPSPGLASLSVTKVESARVTLWNVRLEKIDGRLFLCGHVFRRYAGAVEDTSNTHLVITLFNVQGQLLRELPAGFEPRQIPRGHRGPGYSAFSVALDVLPAGTSRIQVQARDDLAPASTLSVR